MSAEHHATVRRFDEETCNRRRIVPAAEPFPAGDRVVVRRTPIGAVPSA